MTARILDAFPGTEGTATQGYKSAIPGVHVTGVGIDPQPEYPGDGFVQADPVQFILEHGREFDFIHASPPFRIGGEAKDPDLIASTRAVLLRSRRQFVIEAAEAAAPHLFDPMALCGTMFGRRTYGHRLFESGGGFELPPRLHLRHPEKVVKWWLPVHEEAVPPAYTAWIGSLLRARLGDAVNVSQRQHATRVGYTAAHARVKRFRGLARSFTCACGAKAEHWAYDHLDPQELVYQRSAAERPRRYSVDPSHYIAMCCKCHAAFDGRHRVEERRREFSAMDAAAESGDRERATA